MVMFLFVLGFFAVLALASALGLASDSRDGSDWAPTENGQRVNRRVGAC